VTERYLSFSEETNALDYLERAGQFIREAATDDSAWKWVVTIRWRCITSFLHMKQ
jgi:hypothetical protein